MAQTFLIFDFGADENAAQQARHRIEGWKQGFRLDKKILLKFERTARTEDHAAQPASKKGKAKSRATKEQAETEKEAGSSEDVRMVVRLDFSDHEKLSHQRWAERIPSDDVFKTAKPTIIRSGDPDFAATEEHFDSLD